ncbi:MAG TPA: hypothetical protein PKL85_11030, partial [Bacteroidia bacterium]|nr:hypothetical protein [Bacteroidia bacterium]
LSEKLNSTLFVLKKNYSNSNQLKSILKMKTKSIFHIIALLLCSVLFFACPYESSVPIDEANIGTDPRLLGKWKKNNSEDVSIDVTAFDKTHYTIDRIGKSENEMEHYLAFESIVNGFHFLNIQRKDSADGEQKYLLYKMLVRADSVILSEITDNIDEQFSNSTALKKFIAGNMNNSYFFNKEDLVYLKVPN